MWRPVRSKPGPGCLHSHSAVKFLNAMILFGGEREGQTLNELWKFHFGKYNQRLLKKGVVCKVQSKKENTVLCSRRNWLHLPARK
jgi:hypothetical protein